MTWVHQMVLLLLKCVNMKVVYQKNNSSPYLLPPSRQQSIFPEKSSPPANTNSLIPRPPNLALPLPLLQDAIHTLHIRLLLLLLCLSLSGSHRGSPSSLLRRDESLSCAPVFVGGYVFGRNGECCGRAAEHLCLGIETKGYSLGIKVVVERVFSMGHTC